MKLASMSPTTLLNTIRIRRLQPTSCHTTQTGARPSKLGLRLWKLAVSRKATSRVDIAPAVHVRQDQMKHEFGLRCNPPLPPNGRKSHLSAHCSSISAALQFKQFLAHHYSNADRPDTLHPAATRHNCSAGELLTHALRCELQRSQAVHDFGLTVTALFPSQLIAQTADLPQFRSTGPEHGLDPECFDFHVSHIPKTKTSAFQDALRRACVQLQR